MAKTVGFGKLEREVWSNERLPPDVRMALIVFKNRIRSGAYALTIFNNREEGLPEAAVGQVYYEFQVGQARVPMPTDPHARGSRRLVALVSPGNKIERMYFTGDHYIPGTWFELQYP
jgi:guanyl-specific ribonuclease Sa